MSSSRRRPGSSVFDRLKALGPGLRRDDELCAFPGSRVPGPEAGFTLLEMLAVIVLIGIIGGIVVTQVVGKVDKGKYGAGKAQVQVLTQDIQNYALDNGAPPANLEYLITQPPDASGWMGPYAKKKNLTDPWGHAFGYQYPGKHGSFDLIFYGQDGKPGGTKLNRDYGNWQ